MDQTSHLGQRLAVPRLVTREGRGRTAFLEVTHASSATVARRVYINAMAEKLSAGVAHSMPADLRQALLSDPAARTKWEDITPLARNEWICWVISVKKPATRKQHVERVCSELKEGMRRPCCWPGCPHR